MLKQGESTCLADVAINKEPMEYTSIKTDLYSFILIYVLIYIDFCVIKPCICTCNPYMCIYKIPIRVTLISPSDLDRGLLLHPLCSIDLVHMNTYKMQTSMHVHRKYAHLTWAGPRRSGPGPRARPGPGQCEMCISPMYIH